MTVNTSTQMEELAPTPEDQAVMLALRINRETQERDAREVAEEYRRQLGNMATSETIESQLAGIALDYQTEREQLPAPGDSKKVLRQKLLRRTTWGIETGHFTPSGAEMYTSGLDEFGIIIFHRDDQIADPPLLFEPEMDAYSNLRQGWVVGYPDDMNRRKSPTTIHQLQIDPENHGVYLEVGFAVRAATDEKTLAYNALYHIVASRRKDQPDTLAVTDADDNPVTGEDLLFPMGLVLQASREIKLQSPYAETPKSLERRDRQNRLFARLDKPVDRIMNILTLGLMDATGSPYRKKRGVR